MVKNLPAVWETQVPPGWGRSSGEGNGNNTPVFLPGEFHEQRSLAGYSPWDYKESDRTEATKTFPITADLQCCVSF